MHSTPAMRAQRVVSGCRHVVALRRASPRLQRLQTVAMAQPMKLYSFPIAFNPAKALLAIEEKGLKDVEIVNVNLFNGQSVQPWFMRINPNSTTPVLVAGGKTLNQTREILRYFDESVGQPLGGDKVDRALVNELVDTLHAWDGNLYAMANVPEGGKGLLASLGAFKDKAVEAQKRKAESAGDKELAAAYQAKLESQVAARKSLKDAAAVEANKKELEGLLDRAEELLQKNKFLAGPEFSMADVVLSSILFRIGSVKQTRQYLEPRPKLSAYYNEVKMRPSYRKVFAAASSPMTLAGYMVPAVLKAKFAALTGWYA